MTTIDYFAERAKKLRLDRGMSMRELAYKLGITYVSVLHYEQKSRTLNIDTCKLYMDFFNVSAEYLLGLTDDPKRGVSNVKK
jgi:transcriptional regulator with XRE-family HTH domain